MFLRDPTRCVTEHARSGHTLIEMLVALMLITFVFGTIGLMMHVAGDANRRVRDEVELEHGLSRFAAQLRSNAHQAQSATTRDSAAPQARGASFPLHSPSSEQSSTPSCRIGWNGWCAPRGGRVAPRRHILCPRRPWHGGIWKPARAATMVSLLMEPGAAARILALMVLDTTETAIVRVVVDDPQAGRRLMEGNGFAFIECELVVVEIDDATQLPQVMAAFLEAEVNVHYMYCFIPHPQGKSILGISMEDNEIGEKVLTQHGFRVLRQSDVSR